MFLSKIVKQQMQRTHFIVSEIKEAFLKIIFSKKLLFLLTKDRVIRILNEMIKKINDT